MPLEHWLARAFDDEDPTHFGTGWISGTLSVFLGALSIFAVLCLRYPGLLVFADARRHYPLPLIRALLELMIGLAFLLGFVSALLRRRRVLAVTGMSAALLAVLLGGAHAPLGDAGSSRYYLGLDWFVLSLLVTRRCSCPWSGCSRSARGQSVFRRGWGTDLSHFFVSHLLRAAADLPHPAALDGALRLAGRPVGVGRGPFPAPGAPVPGGPAGGRPGRVLDPSPLPRRALPLALPRRSPLGGEHGLDRRLAAARGGHRASCAA